MANEVPNVISRVPGIIDLAIPVEPGVTRYRIRGHRTVNDAFGPTGGVAGAGSIIILEAQSGSYFRSPSILRQKPARIVEESYRNQTRIQFDILDYKAPTNLLPNDEQFLFLRMEKFHVAPAAYLAQGPILVIPPPGFYNTRYPSITFGAKAPGNQALPGVIPPAGSMHLVFPYSVGEMTLENLNSSTGLLFSFGKNMPMMEVAGLVSITHTGEFSEVVFANPQNNVSLAFAFVVQIVNAG